MAETPLSDLVVLEMTHNVMGPMCGLVLADLGAEVIRIEPLTGDPTRKLSGFAVGFAAFFNRNKRSICIDLKSSEGMRVIHDLIRKADVLIENYGPGTLQRRGLGWEEVHAVNERLVYCELKGFLPGPYEHRPAMDEIVQMLGGLAFMTGLPDRPLRAGASVTDITGGLFGATGILAALRQRDRDGRGRRVTSSLYESVAFFMAQHMVQEAISGEPAPPMALRTSTWSVYELFRTNDDQLVFIAILSERHWAALGEVLDIAQLTEDKRFSSNELRLNNKIHFKPTLEKAVSARDLAELCVALEAAGVPFAPVRGPSALFDDPQMNVDGRMLPIVLKPGMDPVNLPTLPLMIEGETMKLRRQPPGNGQHTAEILSRLGYSQAQIDDLKVGDIVR